MPQPPAYTPATDFSQDEVDNVSGRSTVRTAELDAEFSALATTIAAIRTNLSLNQRDDGEIRDARVKLHTLGSDVRALLAAGNIETTNLKGDWITATAYVQLDVVTQSGNTYICAVAHTSGTFATDLAADRWLLLAQGATAASAIAFTPTSNVAASNVQAAIEESDTENRALSSAASALASALDTALRAALLSQSANEGSDLIGINLANQNNANTLGGFLQYFFGRTAAEITAGVTPTNYGYPPGDVRRYGVVGDGSTDDRASIQSALSANDLVIFPLAATYRITAALNLKSNQTIRFVQGATLQLGAGITTEYMLRGTTVSNVVIEGATILGNGLSGVSSIYLSNSTGVTIKDCTIKKSGAMAVLNATGTRITVQNCDLSENYYYGIDDRDGIGNRYIGNRFYLNGNTGVASSTGGRGINLWRCIDCQVIGNRFTNSTEYGFRLYSEAADTGVNRGNQIISNYFEDNGAADLVLYDESQAGTLVFENIISGAVIRRSTEPSLDCAVLLHGGDNIINNVQVVKSGTFGSFTAFLLYYGVRNKVTNCAAKNCRDALAFSSETDCIVDNFYGLTVATAAGAGGVQGAGNVIRNSRFIHGGGGVADVGIINYNATGRNYLEGITLDGFATGIYIDDEAVTVRDCKTLNCTTGFRKDSNAQAGQELIGNVWDSANPTLALALERRAAGNAVLYDTAAPTIRTWAVGDRCFNSSPAAGQPKSWVCTTAGTPGTWTSEGNL